MIGTDSSFKTLVETSIDVTSPLLVKTEGGEYTVQYKGRFLYSKKAPSSSVETLISSISSFENTLFIFASPVLSYGLSSLISHISSSSFIFIVECDEALASLFEKAKQNYQQRQNVYYIHSSNILEIIKKIDELTSFNFKKCTLIRASGGYALYQDFYNELFQDIENEVSNFWKNKITLIAMGSLYAKNIFKNIINFALDEKKRIHPLQKSQLDKPILVLGAGPSLDESYEFIKKNRDRLFLLAVDVALPALSSLSIIPDAVLLLEGQYWVETSFLASNNRNITVFSDISSNPHIFNIMKGNIFLYGSNYAKLFFLSDIKASVSNIPFFDSLGSVGLLAIQIALFISKEGVPIFHTGLDFSYTKGYSHAKGSSSYHNLMINTNRLKSLYIGENIFPTGMLKLDGKKNKKIFSTAILQHYANFYKKIFLHFTNIFDIAKSGVVLREPTSEELAQKIIDDFFKCEHNGVAPLNKTLEIKALLKYLKKEREKLKTLKNMLIGEKKFDKDEVSSIIKTSDYLYSHFPDSTINVMDISFLKRIRIEIDVFSKIISIYKNE